MNSTSMAKRNFHLFKKEFSIVVTFVLMLLTGVAVYFFSRKPSEVVVVNSKSDCPQKINEVRLNDYKFTHPLMFADLPNENDELKDLKEKINQVISEDKSLNLISDISIYFRKMDDGSWFIINGDKTYTPASLMKVSFLIAVLKQAGSDPGLLHKKIHFGKHFQNGFSQNIKSFSLQENKDYTVKELLHDMIAYSDNDALTLISSITDKKVFNKLFTDLGVTSPPIDPSKSVDYTVSIGNYCKLFRILYNSGYLTDENSELGLSMLSQSTYKEGLLRDINPGYPVAHKFGERVDGQVQQLHEIGIFYAEPEPYLLGIMSEGSDQKKLASVLSQISKLVYQNYLKGS